ncbi:hypothetical protein F5Y17DRAFT_233509 [Xylariaceae sp. FL0594]|nr:hypothetical protein F5Y17DRAFT_233509 [Xylariaceae sp. FL0594]
MTDRRGGGSHDGLPGLTRHVSPRQQHRESRLDYRLLRCFHSDEPCHDMTSRFAVTVGHVARPKGEGGEVPTGQGEVPVCVCVCVCARGSENWLQWLCVCVSVLFVTQCGAHSQFFVLFLICERRDGSQRGRILIYQSSESGTSQPTLTLTPWLLELVLSLTPRSPVFFFFLFFPFFSFFCGI